MSLLILNGFCAISMAVGRLNYINKKYFKPKLTSPLHFEYIINLVKFHSSCVRIVHAAILSISDVLIEYYNTIKYVTLKS